MALPTVFEIPLKPNPQKLTIVLAGVTYQLTVFWCDPFQAWIVNIADANGNPILTGLPLVTGLDLLGQFEHLGVGGQLVVQTDHDTLNVPTFTNLGITGHLYFLPG